MTQSPLLFTLAFFSIFWLLHGYITLRFMQMFDIKKRIALLVSLLLTITILSMAYASRVADIPQLSWLSQVVFYEIGWLAITLPWLLLLDVLLLTSRVSACYLPLSLQKNQPWKHYQQYKSTVGKGMILLSILLTVGASLQFHRDIAIEHITLYSDKVSQTYNLLHITDVQLGSTSPEHVTKIGQRMQQAIEEYNVDIILNTGDQVDSATYTAAQLAPIAYTQPPTFFSLGNHEFYHDNERILSILHSQQQIILRSQHAIYKELNIIGIDDKKDKQHLAQQLHASLINHDKYNILLYHRPVGVLDAKQQGIDLMLSGHTHGGQIFPFTLYIKWLYEYPQGLVQLEKLTLYTSDGVGLWGPNLRFGTRNEMAVFTIKPMSEKGMRNP